MRLHTAEGSRVSNKVVCTSFEMMENVFPYWYRERLWRVRSSGKAVLMLTTKRPVISLSSGVVSCNLGHIKVLLSAQKLFLRVSETLEIKISSIAYRMSDGPTKMTIINRPLWPMPELFASISWIIPSAKWVEKGFHFLLWNWICLLSLLLAAYDFFI